MNADFQHMSVDELQFVRLYALTLKKRYDEFFNALQLMRSEIGVRCPVRAAMLARQLHEMGAEFEYALASLATKHSARVRTVPKIPSALELVQLIKVSFFKLVEPPENPQESGDDKGWFSGHPLEWENAWYKIQPKHKKTDIGPALTTMMQAFMQLMNENGSFNITYIPGFPTKKLPPWANDTHQDYEEEDYDDDEDDNYGPDYGISY